MIRRGFWLLAGAALGVSGYRKASRLTRALASSTARPGDSRELAGRRSAARSSLALPAPRRAAADRAPADRAAADRAVADRAGIDWVPAPPWPVRLIAGTRAASGFVRDVRAGMAEYRDLNGREPGRSLGSQRDRAQPGAGERDHREP
jgi:hypothetical protein